MSDDISASLGKRRSSHILRSEAATSAQSSQVLEMKPSKHESSSIICGNGCNDDQASSNGSKSSCSSNDSSCSSSSSHIGYQIIPEHKKLAANRGNKVSTSTSETADATSDTSDSNSSVTDDSISLTASLSSRKCAGSAPASLDLYGLDRHFDNVTAAAGDSNVRVHNDKDDDIAGIQAQDERLHQKMQSQCPTPQQDETQINVDCKYNPAHYLNTPMAPPSSTWYSPQPRPPILSNASPPPPPLMFVNPWVSSGQFIPNYATPTPMLATAPLPMYIHPPSPPIMMFYAPSFLTAPMPFVPTPAVFSTPEHRANSGGGDCSRLMQDPMAETMRKSGKNAATAVEIPIRRTSGVEIPIIRLKKDE